MPKSSFFVIQKSFEGKYDIGFGIPIEFASQRKKKCKNRERDDESMI